MAGSDCCPWPCGVWLKAAAVGVKAAHDTKPTLQVIASSAEINTKLPFAHPEFQQQVADYSGHSRQPLAGEYCRNRSFGVISLEHRQAPVDQRDLAVGRITPIVDISQNCSLTRVSTGFKSAHSSQ